MKKKAFFITIITAILAISSMVLFSASCLTASSSSPVIPGSRDSVTLPVLMYHGITDSKAKVNDYTITADTFRSDLEWLGENGFTSVSAAQLIDYVEKSSPLPAKPVLITFDDGYANNYSLAFPLLQKYHMKSVISVIGSQCDSSSDDIYRNLFNSSLSWGEISIMAAEGNIEIGSHTYNLHSTEGGRKGADMKAGESFETYSLILREDLELNSRKISAASGTVPVVFAWPYGSYPKDRSADAILKEAGFKISLTSYQKMNEIRRGDSDSLFGLKRFLRTPDFDMNKIIW